MDERLQRGTRLGLGAIRRNALRVTRRKDGLLVCVPFGLYEARDHGEPAIGARLEIWMPPRRAERVEVTIDHGDVKDALAVDSRAADGVVTYIAQIGLDLTGTRATVQVP